MEVLDCEDFEVSAMVLENIDPPPKWSVELSSADNNVAGPFSLANVLVDLEFACLF